MTLGEGEMNKKIPFVALIQLALCLVCDAGMGVWKITPDATYEREIKFTQELVKESDFNRELQSVSFHCAWKKPSDKITEVELLLYDGRKLTFRAVLYNPYAVTRLSSYHCEFMVEEKWIKGGMLKLSTDKEGYYLLKLKDFLKTSPNKDIDSDKTDVGQEKR